MRESSEHTTVGDLVAADFRAARVLEQFGIDFCCGGRRSLADACWSAGADPEIVGLAIERVTAEPADAGADVRHWPVDRLIDHIVSKHHAYLRVAMPTIAHHLAKLAGVHGERHPELTRVAATFDRLRHELQQHLIKEENVLFPYIRAQASLASGRPFANPFGTVANPIRMMEREHREAGTELHVIRELTNGYTAPADGCAAYRVTMAELEQFEWDLHRHVHLENNVLFPKAVALELRAAGESFNIEEAL
jgi:regulator of cell morphogenesis and NO signaling